MVYRPSAWVGSEDGGTMLIDRVPIHLAMVAMLAAGVLAAAGRPASAAPGCQDTEVSRARALAAARGCGHRVEDVSSRTETAQTFANLDGTMTLEESVEPRWAHRADGSWAAVDPSLLKAADGGVVPIATAQRMFFSGGGTRPLATLTEGGRELTVSWPAPLPVPTLAGDTAVYAGVLPDVDLRVTATAKGFAEVLVVKTRAAAANPALRTVRFGLSTKDLTVVATAGGGAEARDEQGRAVFVAPAPLMWDSADQGGIRRQAVMPVLVSGNELSITPDPAFLADATVTYPVFIDPDWHGGIWGSQFTSVTSKYPDSSFWQNGSWLNDSSTHGGAGAGLVCDKSSNGVCTSPTYLVRSLFRMDVSGVLGKQVLRATFRIEQRWSWTCNPVSNARLWLTTDIYPDTTWEKQPYWNPGLVADGYANHRYGGGTNCADVGTVEFNATSMVQNAVGVSSPIMIVGLRAISEGTTSQWKRFNFGTATITVNYNSQPTTPDQLTVDGRTCTSGSSRPFVATGSPTLRARVSDPDNDTLTSSFTTAKFDPATGQLVDVPGGGGSQGGVPSGGYAQFTPTGEVDGGIYNMRVVASDPWWSSPSAGNCEWQVDLTNPVAPTVTGDIYRAGSAGCPPEGCGGVGMTGSFTFASSPDVASFRWGFSDPPSNVATPTTLGAPVTVTWTPTSGGPKTLYAKAVDRAGRTATSTVQFVVAGPAPAVARWLLNDPAGSTALADDTGNGHVATLNGGTLGVPGRIVGGDTAARFDGTSSSYAATAHLLDTSRSFSVAAWVRVSDTATARTFVSQDGAHTAGFQLQYAKHCGCWEFAMPHSDAVNPGTAAAVAPGSAPVNVWTHLVGVYDAGVNKVLLYVNGAPAGSAAAPAVPWNATGVFTIARSKWNDTLLDYVAGDVAQVQTWNRVLMTNEIAAMADPLAVGRVGEWHMDEVGPGPAYDASGMAHDLTFGAGASIPPSGAGQSGTGLHLDGTGYARTDGPVVNTDQSFTVSAWVRLTVAPTDTAYPTAVSQAGPRFAGFELQARPSGWCLVMRPSGTVYELPTTACGGAVTLGVWTHLIGVYNAATAQIQIFVNGTRLASITRSTFWNATGPLYIGSTVFDGVNVVSWTGDIDEVRAYAGAVTDVSRIP